MVRQIGLVTQKRSPDLTMVVFLTSPDGRYDSLYLRNYAVIQIRDVLARLPGAGDVRVFGSGDYAMRLWLDPGRIAARNMTVEDVLNAVREQNTEVAAGSIGGQPALPGTEFSYILNARGRLQTEEEFGRIIVKTGEAGDVVYLRDVATIELGPETYALRSMLDGRASVGIPVFQLPGANALELSDAVRRTMAELAQRFPDGVSYEVAYDPTVFVRSSIEAVIETLLEAVALVVLVVVVFLQSWRASVVPLVAVPVAIIGTLAILLLLGFSINSLTLFGLVLATGIVVDDAIVVVENVERKMEGGLGAVAAAHAAMAEVTRPIISIMLVLCCGLHPGRVPERDRRPVLSPVRDHDRRLHRDLDAQFAHAFSGARGAAAQAAARAQPTPSSASSTGYSAASSASSIARFRCVSERYGTGVGAIVGQRRVGAGGVRRVADVHVGAVPDRARRLHSGAGQAISHRHRAAAERRLARSHRSGRTPDVGNRDAHARRRARGRISGAVGERLRQPGQCRSHVSASEGFR